MSFNELIILMVIALVLFGPEDLPDVARAIGKVVFEVKKIAGDMTKEFQDAVNTPSNVLKKTLDDTLKTPAPKKSGQEVKKTAAAAPSTAAAVAPEAEDTPEAADTPKDENATPNKDDEELLTYDEDPLAELPQDMVSYEK